MIKQNWQVFIEDYRSGELENNFPIYFTFYAVLPKIILVKFFKTVEYKRSQTFSPPPVPLQHFEHCLVMLYRNT